MKIPYIKYVWIFYLKPKMGFLLLQTKEGFWEKKVWIKVVMEFKNVEFALWRVYFRHLIGAKTQKKSTKIIAVFFCCRRKLASFLTNEEAIEEKKCQPLIYRFEKDFFYKQKELEGEMKSRVPFHIRYVLTVPLILVYRSYPLMNYWYCYRSIMGWATLQALTNFK